LRERLIARKRPLPDAHFRSLDQVDQIDLDTVVAKREGMMCYVSESLTSSKSRSRKSHEGPSGYRDCVSLHRRFEKAFSVRALPAILSDESKLVLVRRSIRKALDYLKLEAVHSRRRDSVMARAEVRPAIYATQYMVDFIRDRYEV
jgi:hypothetical protein